MSVRGNYLLKRFGISEAQYGELYDGQNGCCAVCKRHSSSFKNRLSVDHDHKSGEIRGLLCINCNRFIVGRHRRELGADLLRNAYAYLTKEYPGWLVPPRTKKSRKARRKRRSKIV